jgi:hypothetical protein
MIRPETNKSRNTTEAPPAMVDTIGPGERRKTASQEPQTKPKRKGEKNMNNAQIIFNESIDLMEKGIIKGTGRFFTLEMEDGTKKQIEEPEAIHTFAAWKELGRQVKKGQHAKAQIRIWKCRVTNAEITANNAEGQEVTINQENKNMFMKTAFFFTLDQTEPIKK